MAFPRSSFDTNSNLDEAERIVDTHLRHSRALPVEVPLTNLPGMRQEEEDHGARGLQKQDDFESFLRVDQRGGVSIGSRFESLSV